MSEKEKVTVICHCGEEVELEFLPISKVYSGLCPNQHPTNRSQKEVEG